ncbi:MAG TPA: prepilin-type N-terminal cleavage/methylation domain-containing protein [bacterium]|nr:prepilin-type N-terminal cleavage/methylation domain-containing protein [bacterium]HPP30022.1 prepilin-type N-terminal cleavage/methylation domain-containing protein [bacterium]
MKRKGFTLIELLVAMAILVVAFGLVTFLYTKAARIRRIVVVNSEVQQALSQIVDTLTYGDKAHWGIMHAAGLSDITQYDTYIVLKKDAAGTDTMVVEMKSDGNITVNWGSGPITLNVGEKVAILTDTPYRSTFRYFDGMGNEIPQPITSSANRNRVTFVKITLWAHSTDPSFKFAEPAPFVTGVKLGNKTSF